MWLNVCVANIWPVHCGCFIIITLCKNYCLRILFCLCDIHDLYKQVIFVIPFILSYYYYYYIYFVKIPVHVLLTVSPAVQVLEIVVCS